MPENREAGPPAESSPPYRAAIITSSDKGFRGEREDLSGEAIRELAERRGYVVVSKIILPDERALLERELRRLCDTGAADLVLTTGGTGFSPRDCMPEATTAVADRMVPGISEALRQHSLAITKRAMFSRAVSAIRGSTLIVNLPGSPGAVRECLEFILDELHHGLDILTGRDGECGRGA
ncbi:MAG: MogA/MoaB family molybdenum cofactor biosynthesis protein [Treponema sp.]|jgi:molybdenum cofactor synthesis domain-containing protein|nr:MogA/MoaB family molybdenum cofactor biosynthesis protein [Treponema sp.]